MFGITGLRLAFFCGFSCWKHLSSSAGSKLSHGQLRTGAALLLLLAVLAGSWFEAEHPQEQADGLGGRTWEEAQSPCSCCCAGAALRLG